MDINELKARLVELNETGKAIRAKADAEKRDLSNDEQVEIDAVMNEFDGIELDISRRERMSNQESRLGESSGRRVPAAQIENVATARTGLQNTILSTPQERGRWGFRNFGEFCQVVRSASNNPGSIDQRLIANSMTTYGAEGVGADGGFAVPPEWRSTIMEAVAGEEGLLSRTDQQTASGNSITFPTDESTAWQTTGGIQAYWDGEASTITQSKPALKEVTIKLHRITALVPVTDELLEDTAALGGYVARKAGDKVAFKVNDAIVNGTGAGQPLGMMTAPALVSVAKETSQVAATIHGRNVVKMMSRLPAQSFARSVWLINQDCVPQILGLSLEISNAAGTVSGGGLIYMPPNGLANSGAYGTLLGRPIIVTEACATLGTKGDIILADMSQYLSVVKAGGVKADTSIHLFFDQNATAFRFVLRMNGQPWLSAPIARKNGSNTLSHFVSLDTRG